MRLVFAALAVSLAGAQGNSPLVKANVTSLTAPWQPLGPAQITSAYDRISGRVTAIAVDPFDSSGNTVFVGPTGGGVWKSTNAAQDPSVVTFAPVTDAFPHVSGPTPVNLSIGAISVQPGGSGVILAGTGDPNDALDSYWGSGILRSTDGGNTWSLISQSNERAFIAPT